MQRSARVKSIDAVEALSAAMGVFGEEATAALESLEMEIRRAVEWIQHDRKEYWAARVRRGYENLAEARHDLERCKLRHLNEDRPSCYEQKQAIEKAKRRLRTAREKVEAVRRWSQTIGRAVIEYRGTVTQMTGWLQADLPRAMAGLGRMSAALESYVHMEGRSASGRAAVASSKEPEDTTSPPQSQDEGPPP